MSRCLLHKSKIDDFQRWLTENGIESREPRGCYELLQISIGKGQWACIYEREHMPERCTTDKRLTGLVRKFIAESKS